ncbi:MAG: hypothetical protein K2X27_22740 [Candidatus Obscuribacterales bacterium]|nr:hypothetical protein [Candidatus Obscuribacterales bacterium]
MLLVAAASFSAWRYFVRPMQVPEFPTVAAGLPAAVVQMEPDIGWRTGDILPVRIYIHEPSGIVVDTRSLMVNGDTRLRDSKVRIQAMPDGSRVLQLDVELQSFVFEERHKAELRVDYRVLATKERKVAILPALEFSSSRTYDGDKTTKHPKDRPAVYAESQGYILTVGLAALGLFGLLSSFWYLLMRPVYRREKAPLMPDTDEWREAVRQVHAILARLKKGEAQVPLLTGLEGLLRRLYNLDAVTVTELQVLSDGAHPALQPLTLVCADCQRSIYANLPLSQKELSNLGELVLEALAALPRFNPSTLGKLAARA